MNKQLFNTTTEKNLELLFQQYHIYLDSIEKNSDRRNSAVKLYIMINAWLLSFMGVIIQTVKLNTLPTILPILIVWIAISVIFYYLIKSYKQLNTGKFELIHKIEEKLPLNLYAYEWVVLGEGKDKNKYFPFSHIEKRLPIILGGVYSLLLLCVIVYQIITSCVCK